MVKNVNSIFLPTQINMAIVTAGKPLTVNGELPQFYIGTPILTGGGMMNESKVSKGATITFRTKVKMVEKVAVVTAQG